MDTAQKASKQHVTIVPVSVLIVITKCIIVTLISVTINIIIVVNIFITFIIIMVNNKLKLSFFFPTKPQYCNEKQIKVSTEKEIKWKK